MEYRRDIDGLRGIAIASVVFFHARVPGFDGGFIGVDVFFVISGFLITGLILSEHARGEFSFAGFYERRTRRILPALLSMLLGTAAISSVLLWPRNLTELAKALLANLVFAGNIFQWRTVDYFGLPQAQMPLAHTWSLGVEEQFYMVFPALLLVFLRRSRRQLVAAVLLAMLASWALCVLATTDHQQAAFYLLPTRMWQLLAGSLLAIVPVRGRISPRVSAVMAIAGLLGVGLSAVFLHEAVAYPGVAATGPTLATAMIIAARADERTMAGRFLCWDPLVALGLVSYSLYLWHWPMLVFTRLGGIRPTFGPSTVVALLAAFALSIASWRYIERPIRASSPRVRLSRVVGGVFFAVVCGLLFAISALRTSGFPQRFSKNVRAQIAATEHELGHFRKRCVNSDLGTMPGAGRCALGVATDGAPAFVLFGDSHARALIPVFDSAARRAGVSGQAMAKGGCLPLLGLRTARDFSLACRHFRDSAFKEIRRSGASLVVLVGYWSNYIDSGQPLASSLICGSCSAESGGADALFEDALRSSIDAFDRAGIRVVVLRDVPSFPFDASERVAEVLRDHGAPASLSVSESVHRARQRSADASIDRATAGSSATVVDWSTTLCRSGECPLADQDGAFYLDSHHLSIHGSMRLLPSIVSLLTLPATPGRSRVDGANERFQ